MVALKQYVRAPIEGSESYPSGKSSSLDSISVTRFAEAQDEACHFDDVMAIPSDLRETAWGSTGGLRLCNGSLICYQCKQ